jgi:DNA-binding transcriptional ArsR family regulator
VTQAGEATEASDWPVLVVAQARWFRTLADPTRLTILKHLLAGPHTVTELVESTGLPQSRISNHLACLRWCRFVNADRRGRHVVYTVADTRLKRMLDLTVHLIADNAEHLATCKRIGPDWI